MWIQQLTKVMSLRIENIESVDVQESVYSMDAVTVGNMREALAGLVRSNTCWCKGAVNGMDISIVRGSLIS